MTGNELLSAIKALGMTQKEFAERVGRRQETVSRYVNGEYEIPPVVELAVAGLRGGENGAVES